MKIDNMPKPTELMDNPQLAVLVSLETTLVAAIRALLAVHTDLLDDTFPRTVNEVDYWADRIIHLGLTTEKVLVKYRTAIEEKMSSGEEEF